MRGNARAPFGLRENALVKVARVRHGVKRSAAVLHRVARRLAGGVVGPRIGHSAHGRARQEPIHLAAWVPLSRERSLALEQTALVVAVGHG